MKKILALISAVFFLTLIPMSVVNAAELPQEQKVQYRTQIKERREIIRQNTANNNRLELQIDDRSEELGKVIVKLFDREMPPSEDKLSQITNLQESVVKNAEQVAVTQRSIRRLKKEASINVNEQNYQQALQNFDKIIELQEKERELLLAFDKNIQGLIELINSLQYK